MFIRRGSRRAVWCIDTLVVWGYMLFFLFSNYITCLIGDSSALYLCSFLMTSKFAFGQGMYVCSISLSLC